MVLRYHSFGGSGQIHQGEIIFGVQEYQPEHTGTRLSAGNTHLNGEVFDRRVVAVTPECDLLSDFSARQYLETGNLPDGERTKQEARLLAHIHLCEVFEETDIKQLVPLGNRFWERVKNNQDMRYHKVPAGTIDGQETVETPDFFLDFKRMFSIPAPFLYKSLQSSGVERRGVIPSPWVDSLIDRLFHFQGRVCVPDADDPRLTTPSLQRG